MLFHVVSFQKLDVLIHASMIRPSSQLWLNCCHELKGKMLDVKRDESVKKKKEISIIRSSAAEYLTFITATGESNVNAIHFEENVWLNQKTMGLLYNVETYTI